MHDRVFVCIALSSADDLNTFKSSGGGYHTEGIATLQFGDEQEKLLIVRKPLGFQDSGKGLHVCHTDDAHYTRKIENK